MRKGIFFLISFCSFVVICLNIIILAFIYNVVSVSQVHAQTFDSTSVAQSFYSQCYTGGDGEYCYEKLFENFARTHDYSQSLSVLSALQSRDSSALGCHLIAHGISQGETYAHPNQWMAYIAQVDPNICSGGLIHGVLEAHAFLNKGFQYNAAAIDSICTYIAKTQGNDGRQNCAHIFGHLSNVESKGDMDKGIGICNGIMQDMQFECDTGVFMENETRLELSAEGFAKIVPWDDSFIASQRKVCNLQTGIVQTACWREMAHLFADKENNNPLLVYKDCETAPTSDAASECYIHGVTIIVSSITTATHTFSISDICSPVLNDPSRAQQCYTTAVWAILIDSTQFINRADSICASAPDTYKAVCYQEIGSTLDQVTKSQAEKQTYCDVIKEEQFQNVCISS